MANQQYFTEEIKNELMANPFTYRVTDHHVLFTLAFKSFVLTEFQRTV